MTLQLDMFAPAYPDAPGFKELGQTSEAAAKAIASRVNRLQGMALRMLHHHPHGLTADEIAAMNGEDRLAMRPRLTELCRMGKVEKTGILRGNASGRAAHVWRLRGNGDDDHS